MPDHPQNTDRLMDQLTLYQVANGSTEAVKRNFVLRTAEFELIMSDLRRKKPGDPLQHELILGQRGSGKSTLLRRIQIDIDEDAQLAQQFIAINLAEEQAAVYRLSDLWFEVLQELRSRWNSTLPLRNFDDFDDNQKYARYLYTEIHQLLQLRGKRVLLLLDNLDRILQNFDDDGHLLRETLLNFNDLQIIGGSTRMDEHFWRYDRPFYEFFRQHRLEGLRFEEIHQLLNHWSTEMNLPLLHNYALQHRGRMEAIRTLTDNLPRTWQVVIQALWYNANASGFDYLRKVMDCITPLYQERLGNLTPPQRKILQEMAFWWEAVPTKVLVDKCRMESKLIASYLRQLEQYGLVETISTGKKNHLYRVSERFFSLWMMVTQGNPGQKRRAKYLTLFLESWFEAQELKEPVQSAFIGVEEPDARMEYARKSGKERPGNFLDAVNESNDHPWGIEIIMEVWNGRFENLTEKIDHLMQTSQEEDLTWVLSNLLYLEQNQLVRLLFESERYGKMLRERYELLYYVTLILNHKTEENLLLKIPPEVLFTVQEMVEKVKEKRVFHQSKV